MVQYAVARQHSRCCPSEYQIDPRETMTTTWTAMEQTVGAFNNPEQPVNPCCNEVVKSIVDNHQHTLRTATGRRVKAASVAPSSTWTTKDADEMSAICVHTGYLSALPLAPVL